MKLKSFLPALFLLLLLSACYSCKNTTQTEYNDGIIYYKPVTLTDNEKEIIRTSIAPLHERYDADMKMLSRIISGYNYHTDATEGKFHEVRASFSYAVSLLDLGDTNYTKRAFDIIEKTITLQDQDPASKSCGVWPYYLEEPLATKKSPIDYNWADFNAVSLLDVWMGHQDEIPANLKDKIRNALILAARSVQKRNMGPSYTNIAIMGTYVTYLTSHLFDIADMKEYAKQRLKNFYDYTSVKGGFTEYNSPTYTIVALDELIRMKQHIIEPSAVAIIESLYRTGWEMIARHYHKPTGQWTGPHSRSYGSIAPGSFYAILKEASNGRITDGIPVNRADVKIKHTIPEDLLSYFLTPEYPRTETDIFEKDEPSITGTSYMTESYALSTANRSGLWNQRRPFLAYWGTQNEPRYLQVRFLHDLYDFSSSSFYSSQTENKVLACINFVTNGGDKHISIDRLTDGKFIAGDLRLRFEFGNVINKEEMSVPVSLNSPFSIKTGGLSFNIQLLTAVFENLPCHWEKGGDGKSSWIDLVIWSGQPKEFNLLDIKRAVLAFTFSMGQAGSILPSGEPSVSEENEMLKAVWNDMTLTVPVRPQPLPKNL